VVDRYGSAVLYVLPVHAVIETPTFLADLKAAGVSDDEHRRIINALAAAPLAGDLISGTGGARKRRIEGKRQGQTRSVSGHHLLRRAGCSGVPAGAGVQGTEG
jgi:hypothetical protein